MRTKALVLDIDGTLTNSEKEISPVTAGCIRGIQEKGHCVILASGRPLFGMRRYARELELEIRDFCNKKLAEYKWIRAIEFVEQLPKTISGKVRKEALRKG